MTLVCGCASSSGSIRLIGLAHCSKQLVGVRLFFHLRTDTV